MELVKNTCEPVIPREQVSDDSTDRDLEALRKKKPKVKADHDFPPSCGINEASRKPLKRLRRVHLHLENNKLNSLKPNEFAEKTKVITRKPLKVLDHVDTNIGKMNSHVKDKAVNSKSHAECRKNQSSFGLKPAVKDDYNDRDLEVLRKQKPKVLAVRDFPPGCGGIKEADRKPLKKLRKVHLHLENNNEYAEKTKVITSIVTERKLLKVLDNVNTNTEKMNLCMMDKAVSSKSVQHDKRKSLEHTEFRSNKPSTGSNPAGRVTFRDTTCTKEGHDQQPKDTATTLSRGKHLKNSDNIDSNGDDKRFQPKEFSRNKPSVSSKEGEAQNSEVGTTTGSQKEHEKREKIKEAMSVFDQVYTQLLQDNRLKPKGEKIANWRVPVVVANITKQMLKWMEPEKSLGPICGVQIGDKFKYRSQLKMIGLHCQPLSGIDYTNVEGKNVAVSIVDSHRYSNESGSSDMLIYSGHGGLRFLGPKLPPEDQKLERGNLALKNSMDERTPVRVIRKVEVFEQNGMFVYDGLYVVKHYTQKRNEGRIEYKFHLNRVPGQPPLHQMLNASC